MKHLRNCSGLALLVLTVSPGPSDDDSTAFLTAPQAYVRVSSAELPTVSVSADGRYIAFTSQARLTPGDANDHADVYVLDRISREVTLETFETGDLVYESPRLSGDGRLLLYERNGSANSGASRVLEVRDRSTGTARTIASPAGAGNGALRNGAISADGRTVVFTSAATNLVAGPDANGPSDDVFRYDLSSATFSLISLDRAGRHPSAGASFAPSISADGRFVAFSSTAPLEGRPARSRGGRPVVDLYIRDLTASITTRVSARPDGAPPNGSSYGAAISGDGRYVAFVSEATDLVKRDANRAADIFLFDVSTRMTVLVSRSEGGGSANGTSRHPAISAAGTVVSFQSDASDLTCANRCAPEIRDINLVADIFAYDTRTRALSRVSTGRRSWKEPSVGPGVDGTGTIIAFSSRHPRESRDDGDDYDLFVRQPPK